MEQSRKRNEALEESKLKEEHLEKASGGLPIFSERPCQKCGKMRYLDELGYCSDCGFKLGK